MHFLFRGAVEGHFDSSQGISWCVGIDLSSRHQRTLGLDHAGFSQRKPIWEVSSNRNYFRWGYHSIFDHNVFQRRLPEGLRYEANRPYQQ